MTKAIELEISKDIEFQRVMSMSVEQKKEVISRKEIEIFKALDFSDKSSYKDAVSSLLKSKYYLVIERLVLNGFAQKDIAEYIKHELGDVDLAKLKISTLRSYIAKLKIGLEKSKLLLKQYTKKPQKAKEIEIRLENAVDEVEIIGRMINLQENRIMEMRKEEILNKEHNKEIKNEIKLVVSLVDTSTKIKDIMGVHQKDNRNAFEIFKEGSNKQYNRLLNRDSAKRIREFMSLFINAPHKSNMIKEDELVHVIPENAPDVSALIETKNKIKKGEIRGDETFFSTPRKHSSALSVKISDTIINDVDYELESRDFKDIEVHSEDKKNDDVVIDEDEGVMIQDYDELEDFE